MKHYRLYTLLFFIMSALHAMAISSDTIVVRGTVTDSLGNPLAVAIVEQRETHNYVFSKPDGTFELKVVSKYGNKRLEKVGIPIYVTLVGYDTQPVILNNSNKESLQVVLIEGGERAKTRKVKKWKTITSLSAYVGYNFTDVSFNRFDDLRDDQVYLLNKTKNYIGFGFSSYIRNIYLDLGFSFSPTVKGESEIYRHYSDGTHIKFNIGYGFPFYDKKLIVTPYWGSSYLGINEYIAPLDRKVSLENYLQQGYMDLLFKQYIATIGGKADLRLYEFGKGRQAIYLSAGVGYSFHYNLYPKISAKGTRITSPNRLIVFPVSCEVSVRYMLNLFTWKDKKP